MYPNSLLIDLKCEKKIVYLINVFKSQLINLYTRNAFEDKRRGENFFFKYYSALMSTVKKINDYLKCMNK